MARKDHGRRTHSPYERVNIGNRLKARQWRLDRLDQRNH